MKKTYKIILTVIMCMMLTAASCGDDTGEFAEPEKSPSQIVAKDAQFSGVVKSIDASGLAINILDLNYNSDMSLYIAEDTEIYNSGNSLTTVASIEPGMLVSVEYDGVTMTAMKIEPCEDSWSYDDIENWSLGDEESIMKIGDKKYKYDSNLVVIEGDTIQELMSLNEVDKLKAYGIGRKVYSLIVQKGHGYIRPSSYSDFVGGTMYIGYTLNQPVTEDMLVVVPEGSYEVTMRNGDLEGTKPVEILRNRESLLDMSEFKQKPEDKGHVIFDISPYGADLYINGKLTEYNEPIELNYGKHDVKVELIGYEPYSGLLNVKSPNPTVVIDLTEENANVEENNTEDNKDNNSSNSTSNNNTANNNTDNNNTDNNNSNNGTNNNNNSATVTSAPETKTSLDSANDSSDSSDTSDNKSVVYDKDHTITVKEPAGAEVYFNGEYKGIAPCSFPKVIGNETITLSSSGYQTKSYTVVIPNDGQDVTWSFPQLTTQ